MTEPVVVSKRPTWVSSALAVVLAAYAVSVVGSESVVQQGLLLVVLGVFVVAVAGVGYPTVTLASAPALVDVLPGFVGVLLVGLALVPLRGHGSRWLLRLGVGLAFVSVLASAVVQETTAAEQLFAGTICVVAWDIGENAISIGKQLGRHARTWSIELSHFTGTAVVAFVAVRVSNYAAGFQTPDQSLTTLVVLVGGVLLLTAGLHD